MTGLMVMAMMASTSIADGSSGKAADASKKTSTRPAGQDLRFRAFGGYCHCGGMQSLTSCGKTGILSGSLVVTNILHQLKIV